MFSLTTYFWPFIFYQPLLCSHSLLFVKRAQQMRSIVYDQPLLTVIISISAAGWSYKVDYSCSAGNFHFKLFTPLSLYWQLQWWIHLRLSASILLALAYNCLKWKSAGNWTRQGAFSYGKNRWRPVMSSSWSHQPRNWLQWYLMSSSRAVDLETFERSSPWGRLLPRIILLTQFQRLAATKRFTVDRISWNRLQLIRL